MEITLKLSVEEVNSVLQVLGELPSKTGAWPLIVKIKTQAGKSLTGLNLGGDYYKRGDVYIEKSSSAINTGGELKQITFKGIATQKRKSVGVF